MPVTNVKRVRGHNLLEVVLATMIFSTAVIIFVGVWAQFYTAMGVSRNRLAAASLARAILEQKVAAGYNACDPALPSAATNVTSYSEIRGRPSNCEFTYQFYAADTQPGFRRLMVKIAWADSTGDKVVTYETFLYRTN